MTDAIIVPSDWRQKTVKDQADGVAGIIAGFRQELLELRAAGEKTQLSMTTLAQKVQALEAENKVLRTRLDAGASRVRELEESVAAEKDRVESLVAQVSEMQLDAEWASAVADAEGIPQESAEKVYWHAEAAAPDDWTTVGDLRKKIRAACATHSFVNAPAREIIDQLEDEGFEVQRLGRNPNEWSVWAIGV